LGNVERANKRCRPRFSPDYFIIRSAGIQASENAG
jgi:hypothetical protein